MTAALPQSWAKGEVADALGISPKEIDRLIRSGSIGYYRAGRSKRFLPEHIGQIVAALEVKPTAQRDDASALELIGVTPRSVARRRSA